MRGADEQTGSLFSYLRREDDGTLTGEIRFHLSDESSFTARRWQIFRTLLS
jgi:hypothetical protein